MPEEAKMGSITNKSNGYVDRIWQINSVNDKQMQELNAIMAKLGIGLSQQDGDPMPDGNDIGAAIVFVESSQYQIGRAISAILSIL